MTNTFTDEYAPTTGWDVMYPGSNGDTLTERRSRKSWAIFDAHHLAHTLGWSYVVRNSDRRIVAQYGMEDAQ